MDELDDTRRPSKPQERKKPRKLSERYLENSALHYLKRYSATVDGVRRVMMRRVNRSLKEHGGDKAQAVAWASFCAASSGATPLRRSFCEMTRALRPDARSEWARVSA